MNMIVSQKISTTINVEETNLLPCSNISHRVFPRLTAILNAWALQQQIQNKGSHRPNQSYPQPHDTFF
jgi:hypothetical protein